MCCVALPCLFVCLTLLASFFLPSHLVYVVRTVVVYVLCNDSANVAVWSAAVILCAKPPGNVLRWDIVIVLCMWLSLCPHYAAFVGRQGVVWDIHTRTPTVHT